MLRIWSRWYHTSRAIPCRNHHNYIPCEDEVVQVLQQQKLLSPVDLMQRVKRTMVVEAEVKHPDIGRGADNGLQ
jgi:hypothetical protein